MTNIHQILRIDASARSAGSVTRSLADEALDHLTGLGAANVTRRDVSGGLPFVDEDWVAANFTPVDDRTTTHRDQLAFSDRLVDELRAADTVLIATPIYNFGIPATLKAWVDMICRVGLTFRYTDNGPVGLLQGKRAIILVASGGTTVGSPIDFATPYLKQALKFIGIADVTIIASDAMSNGAKEKRAQASAQIDILQAA
jgi:FMN-dependent NADH-azoreductase